MLCRRAHQQQHRHPEVAGHGHWGFARQGVEFGENADEAEKDDAQRIEGTRPESGFKGGARVGDESQVG